MRKLIKISLAAALPVLWAAGCSDFLKGGELTNNPNNPTVGTATNNQLFISIQANLFSQQTSEVAWSIAQWMQDLYGNARQQVGVYNYSGLNNGTFDGDFQVPYTGGGLVDIRQLEAQATAQGDNIYLGIAQIMEAWMIGDAADMWGDIPYSQADNYLTYPTPQLDTQQSVYNAIETLLSTAITNLGLAGSGPGGSDLVYGGNTAKWIALAHTLKARFLLHQVAVGAATYAQVITEANSGIASPAGDYVGSFVNGIQFSSNPWWQFMNANGGTGRAGDLIARNAQPLSQMLLTAGDPRYGEYFDSTNVNSGFMSNYRQSAGYAQPFVTYAENQLILAEATMATSGAAAANVFLAAAQNSWHVAAKWHNALAGVAVTPVGSTSMTTIMNEKWITMFQNKEKWNDWKRTCIPTLTPILLNPTFGNTVPSRLLYGVTEQQTNPNIPVVGTPPNGAFNWNDANQGCTS